MREKYEVTCKNKWCPYLHEGEDVSSLGNFRNLPVNLAVEDDNICEKIDSAEDLKALIKGSKHLLDGSYEDKVAKYKDFLRSQSAAYLQQREKESAVVEAVKPVAV